MQGGPITVLGENMDAVLKAVANFDSTVTDQKAGFFFAVQRQISPVCDFSPYKIVNLMLLL